MGNDRKSRPLVYSCSGCSSAAQLANDVALQLDRRGKAEMSCIAGVGGDVPALLKLARSGRPIMAIDGCPLVCAKSALARHGIVPARHFQRFCRGKGKTRTNGGISRTAYAASE
ncbi:putative zinc-binding protein [Paraburkholderia sp. MM5384-R2]|uniref:putative zinc-binding protein n=1 Tax=Paraburkholderia sp. MM5384-R2 TaxID=2723097 RepID=UPI0016094EA1|nr:putative zinc-binding protein [Paraburkholderia sp. MM5384-R2]MBB5503285.1 putative metal-binding protein [Paraburkholderia sp. MM5384-R2]